LLLGAQKHQLLPQGLFLLLPLQEQQAVPLLPQQVQQHQPLVVLVHQGSLHHLLLPLLQLLLFKLLLLLVVGVRTALGDSRSHGQITRCNAAGSTPSRGLHQAKG
jgi:hypothetical protein